MNRRTRLRDAALIMTFLAGLLIIGALL